MSEDHATLIRLNAQFIEAWRIGSRELLDEVLDDGFVYTNGATGETADRDDYRGRLKGPNPTIKLDDVQVQVFGDTAVATGRTTRDGRAFMRYVDTWTRANGRWTCVHGCNWPVPAETS